MTLSELGKEYLLRHEQVKQRIHDLRPQLKKLSGDEEEKLLLRLRGLYAMSLDCKIIGTRLREYYTEEDNRWAI